MLLATKHYCRQVLNYLSGLMALDSTYFVISETRYGRTIYNMACVIKQRPGTRHYTELKGIGAQGWE